MFDFLDFSFQVFMQTKVLAFLFGGAIIYSLFVFITARVPFWVRFVVVPIILSLTIWGYAQLDNMLGYPYWGSPTEQAILLGYDFQQNARGELEIILWVREKDGSRLYSVPWSKAKEQKLREAGDGMKKGKRYGIQKGQEINRYEDFILHEFEKFEYPEKAKQ